MLVSASGARRARDGRFCLAGLLFAALALPAQAQELAAGADAAATELAQANDPLLDRSLVVDIAAQDLASAIIQLSKLAGVQVVMRGGHLNDLTTPGLHGELTLRAALTKLLEGSGYSFHSAGGDIIGIDPPPGTDASADQHADPATLESLAALSALSAADAAAGPLAIIPVEPIDQKSSAASAGPTEATDGIARLEDIVVTATKRPQRLRDIPQSITALNGDDLERRGVQNLQDIVKLVPGVNMSYDAIAPRVTIRGISQSSNTSPTTGAIFGNVSFADAYLPIATLDANPFDLESVEVLKGPQGTLFGSSNLNGAVRYVPKAPDPGIWEAKYYGQYTGVDGAWAPSYGAVVNAPLLGRDDLAVRVAAFEHKAPGYIDLPRMGLSDSNETHQKGARVMLAWQPDDWDLGFTYAYQSTDKDNVADTDNSEGELENNSTIRLSTQAQAYNLVDLSLAYDFGWAKLTSETSSVAKRANNFIDQSFTLAPNSPIPLQSQLSAEQSHTYCEELRLSSPEDQLADWHWIVGALGWKEIIHADAGINIDPLAALPLGIPLGSIPGGLLTDDGIVLVRANTDVSAREYALFGEITHRFNDVVEMTLGGRYYRTLSGGDNVVTGVGVLTQGAIDPSSPLVYTLSAEIPESGFNPKASLSLHLTDNVMTYAAISRGYRVGGLQYGVALVPNPTNPVPTLFKSDTIWNYEAGIRTEWLDKALRVDLTGYYEDWKDPQYYTPDASGISYYLTNVGGVRTTGAEGAIQYMTPWGILLGTSASYSRTVTTEVFKAPDGSEAPPGTPWPYSPKWQTASTINYIADVGGWNINTGAAYSYMGQAISDLGSQLPIYGFRQLDFSFQTSNAGIAWLPELSLSLNNALDERGVGAQSIVATGIYHSVTYIQPRTLNLRLVGHF